MSRRKHSSHPGVMIRRRKLAGRNAYSYRFRDPLTKKLVEKIFDRKLFPDELSRTRRAEEISEAIRKKRDEIASGIAIKTSTKIETGISSFESQCRSIPLREPTVKKYLYASGIFRDWTTICQTTEIEKIRKGTLTAFVKYLRNRNKEAPLKGGRAGERQPTNEGLTQNTIDGILRPVKAMLNSWAEDELLPLTPVEIKLGLKFESHKKRFEPRYFKPEDCRRLLEAAIKHDEETIAVGSENDRRLRFLELAAARRAPIAPIVLFFLLSGCRHKEVRNLRWDNVRLDSMDSNGNRVGEIFLESKDTKTNAWRTIGLEVCPSLRELLSALKRYAGDNKYVFGGDSPLAATSLNMPRQRLREQYGVRPFTWQHLRQTTGTYLTNAPGIYSAASVYLSARQLGHSVAIAEKHYLGVERGISRDARTLEQAMQIEDLAKKIIDRVTSRTFAAVRKLFVKPRTSAH